MATYSSSEPTNAAKRALRSVEDDVTCGVCLERYKKPKQLQCCHAFCEVCLQQLVQGRNLQCPKCRKITELSTDGVSGLQTHFYFYTLIEAGAALEKYTSKDYCPSHSEKEADLYCEKCEQLICSYCLISDHNSHQVDKVQKSFSKLEKIIVNSLQPVEERIAMLERAIESANARYAEVTEQKKAVVAEIHTATTKLQQVIEARERELVSRAEHMTQQKIKTLVAQRRRFEEQLERLKRSHDSVEKQRCTGSQGKILCRKSSLLKQVNDLADSLKPESFPLAVQADMFLTHNHPELMKACQEFGNVYCHPVCPEKCHASCEGIKVITRGKEEVFSVAVLDEQEEAYLRHVESLKCELVASDGSSRVRGTAKRINQNIYNISYRPQVTGKHQLHILIQDHPIFNSPFTVTVLPDLSTPASTIRDLKGPWGIAVLERGKIVVAQLGHECISSIDSKGERKSFGTLGSESGQLSSPEGVTVDDDGNILVADHYNHRIQQFSSNGCHLKSVGSEGSGPLQFRNPRGITVHPYTHKVYIADWGNNQIQVLNSDLSYASSFGEKGSNKGEFRAPSDIAIDSKGNVYVADLYNHRIQVFTNGVYLKEFGKQSGLEEPVSITIDSHDVVYVGDGRNNRLSIFHTDGEFIKSIGKEENGPLQFDGPHGLAVDKEGTLYVCDTFNHRIQIFT